MDANLGVSHSCNVNGCGCGTVHEPSCPFSIIPFYSPSPTVVPVTPSFPSEPYVLPSPSPFTIETVPATNWHFTVTPMTAEQRIRALAEQTKVKITLRADDEGWFVAIGRTKVSGHPSLENAFEALLKELLLLGVISS